MKFKTRFKMRFHTPSKTPFSLRFHVVRHATIAASTLLLAAPSFGLAPTHRTHATPPATVKHAPVKATANAGRTTAHHESAGMDPDRATQIQTALIKAGYLNGSPTGTWDADSIAAMQKLQSDNGWQTKLVPDSRALIKLGLGPNSTPAATSPQQ